MRTETTTRNLYQYEELSDAAKATARNWYRRASEGDTFFSESVIDDFCTTVAPCFGWQISRAKHGAGRAVYWSGFWSQGDGACFEGEWNARNVDPDKLAASCPADDRLRGIMADMVAARDMFLPPGADPDETTTTATVVQAGHYSHSGCTRFESDTEIDGALDALRDASRQLMDWLYQALESEYEYQNSDECVAEIILANGYEFTEDGERA